jgi:hypothetical protein
LCILVIYSLLGGIRWCCLRRRQRVLNGEWLMLARVTSWPAIKSLFILVAREIKVCQWTEYI